MGGHSRGVFFDDRERILITLLPESAEILDAVVVDMYGEHSSDYGRYLRYQVAEAILRQALRTLRDQPEIWGEFVREGLEK